MERTEGHLPVTGCLNVAELQTQSLLLKFLILSQMPDTWRVELIQLYVNSWVKFV